ncbi:hypothetical protein PsYK624_014720 [Phanerochaete sordida]|uniref:C2H2-type domain-containing protein n=1 Tax=Phanerochaete sordida TaxID=48140 RepID=A0A9P3L8V6_9APHY|nr:hypothetical protein PsYK624_014720 [Phanerochaete sordida]
MIHPRLETEDKETDCPVCGELRGNGFLLLDHLQGHRTKLRTTDGQFNCPYYKQGCSTAMKQWTNLKTHINRHLSIRPHKCPDSLPLENAQDQAGETKCLYRTSDQASLTKHRRDVHGVIPPPRAGRRTARAVRSPSISTVATSESATIPSRPSTAATSDFDDDDETPRKPAPLAVTNWADTSAKSSRSVVTTHFLEPVLVTPQFPGPQLEPIREITLRQRRPTLPPIRDHFADCNLGKPLNHSAYRPRYPGELPLLRLPVPLLVDNPTPPSNLLSYPQLGSSTCMDSHSRTLHRSAPRPLLTDYPTYDASGRRYLASSHESHRMSPSSWHEGLMIEPSTPGM